MAPRKRKTDKSARSKTRHFLTFTAKCVLWTIGVLLVLLLVAGTLIRILYPPEKLKEIAIHELESSLQRTVTIDQFRFGIFTGLQLHDVNIINSTGDSAASPIQSANIEKLVLKYRLLSLLKRQIKIREIVIERPRVELLILSHRKNESEPNIPPPDPVVQIDQEIEEERSTALPFSVDLSTLRVTDLECALTILSDSSKMATSIKGLSFAFTNFSMPRSENEPWQKMAGNVDIRSEKAPAFFTQQQLTTKSPFHIQGDLSLFFDGSLQSFKNTEASLEIDLENGMLQLPGTPIKNEQTSGTPTLPKITVATKANGNIVSGDYQIEKLTAQIGRGVMLELAGKLIALSSNPGIDAIIKKSRISIRETKSTISSIFPAVKIDSLLSGEVNGEVSIDGTEMRGNFPRNGSQNSLLMHGIIKIENLDANYTTLLYGKNIGLQADVTTELSSLGLENSKFSTEISYSNLDFNLNDTTTIPTQGGYFSTSATFDTQMRPTQFNFESDISKILDGSFDAQFRVSSATAFPNWRGHGDINIHDIELGQLLPNFARGAINFKTKIDLPEPNTLRLNLSGKQDSVYVRTADEFELLPALNIKTKIHARLDTTFKNYYLDSLSLALNRDIALNGSGTFESIDKDKNRLFFQIHQVAIRHDSLFSYLPQKIKSSIGELEVKGDTKISGVFNAEVGQEFEYTAKTHLHSHHSVINYPENNLRVENTELQSDFEILDGNGSASAFLAIGNASVPQLRLDPLKNSKLRLFCSLPQLKDVIIDSSVLSIPDLALRAALNGSIIQNERAPLITAHSQLSFQSTDSTLITHNLVLRGATNVATSFSMLDTVISLSGTARFAGLDVFSGDAAAAYGIQGNIPFIQKVDISSNKMISDSLYINTLAGSGSEYPDLFGDFYQRSLPQLGRLSVNRLSAASWEMQNLQAQILIGSGRVVMPSLAFQMFEGNFKGSSSFDLHENDIRKATYSLQGHLSQINSAFITRETEEKPEQGVINANFLFTGRGLDIKDDINLNGYFYITKIGPRTADNLLHSLDPEGIDSGIRLTRFLINAGFRPKLMIFEAKHGYCYPEILYTQPWYFPVKIDRMSLARLPIKFFIDLITQGNT